MTRKEIVTLLSMATANFPSTQKQDLTATLMLWEKALSDIPYQVAENAVIKVLATSKFFPTIAEIREAATQLRQPRKIDAMEAWGQIMTAVRRYGSYRESEGVASLPADIAKMVERFTWREICTNDNPDTLRAQFRMAWEVESKRENEYASLPPEISKMIEGATKGMMLSEGLRKL